MTAEHVKRLKLPGAEGALVESVNPNSPAVKAGLRENDVIVFFDGERVRSTSQLARLVLETPAGRDVPMGVMRDGRRTELRIAPELGGGTWFDPRFGETLDLLVQGVRDGATDGRSRSRLGVNVHDVSGELAGYFGVKAGVLVTAVRPDSAAAKAGLKAGDVITAVNGKPITASRELLSVIPDGGSTEELSVTIVRERKETTLRASMQR